MDRLSQDELRALDKEELSLFEQSMGDLTRLGGSQLADLVRRLRDRRDRARDLADRQRREARGKAEPAGLHPAGGDEGMRLKKQVLTAALDRATAAQDAGRT